MTNRFDVEGDWDQFLGELEARGYVLDDMTDDELQAIWEEER
jgi:hypothetical protein